MKLAVTFSEKDASFDVDFGSVNNISDGGFERGYAEGHEDGTAEGYTKGHEDGKAEGYEEGLAARTYEVWTITLADGTVVEKEMALL